MRAWIALVLVTAAAGISVTLFSWRARDPRPASTQPATQAGEVASELTGLRREVDLLKAKSKQPKVVLVAPSGRAEAPRESAPSSPEAQKAVAQEQERKVAATLEDKLASETVDPVWSRKRSQDLRDAVGTQDPRSVVSSVACASTLCKLVLNHDTVAAQREIATKLVEARAVPRGSRPQLRQGRHPAEDHPLRAARATRLQRDLPRPVTVTVTVTAGRWWPARCLIHL